MPRTRSERPSRAQKTGFRPGHSGACEARLYQFTGVAIGEEQPPVEWVAASDLHEAIAYMLKWHSNLEFLARQLLTTRIEGLRLLQHNFSDLFLSLLVHGLFLSPDREPGVSFAIQQRSTRSPLASRESGGKTRLDATLSAN